MLKLMQYNTVFTSDQIKTMNFTLTFMH